MNPHELRTISLVSLVPIILLVRHTVGFVDSSNRGLAFTVLLLSVGGAPLFRRLVMRLRALRAPTRVTDGSPYRTAPATVAESPLRSSARDVFGDLLCLALTVAVWAELRSAEPLQRFPRIDPYAQKT